MILSRKRNRVNGDQLRWLQEYLAELEGRRFSPHTTRNYKLVLSAWQESGLDPQSWLYGLQDTHEASTVNAYRRALAAYHSWLVRKGYASVNPITAIPQLRQAQKLIHALSVPEVARLIDCCSMLGRERTRGPHVAALGHWPIEAYRARLAAMVSMQVTAGMRVTELCTVRRDAVDLESRTVQVVRKGNKEAKLRFGRSAKRKIEAWAKWTRNDSPFLFCGVNGKPVDTRSYRRQLSEAAYWAELEGITPHTLRHTFATLAIDSGIPIADVQSMLGHANVTTTQLYLHRHADRGWDRYDRLDDQFA